MGNRNVSIYCFGESNEQSLNLVSMRRNLNCEIVIDTFILHHCDYNLFWFSQQHTMLLKCTGNIYFLR